MEARIAPPPSDGEQKHWRPLHLPIINDSQTDSLPIPPPASPPSSPRHHSSRPLSYRDPDDPSILYLPPIPTGASPSSPNREIIPPPTTSPFTTNSSSFIHARKRLNTSQTISNTTNNAKNSNEPPNSPSTTSSTTPLRTSTTISRTTPTSASPSKTVPLRTSTTSITPSSTPQTESTDKPSSPIRTSTSIQRNTTSSSSSTTTSALETLLSGPTDESDDEDNGPSVSTTVTNELKKSLELLKKGLKKPFRFEESVAELNKLMKEQLTFENKSLFYNALNIVSYRVGKPGFSAEVALPLFETAMSMINKFSAGYKRNITEWHNTIKALVNNPTQTPKRSDGRFGGGKTSCIADYELIIAQLLHQPDTKKLHRVILHCLNCCCSETCSSRRTYSSEEESSSSDDESDAEPSPSSTSSASSVGLRMSGLIPRNGSWIPNGNNGAAVSVAVSNGVAVPKASDDYPFSKVTPDAPLLYNTKLKHNNEPTSYPFGFSISQDKYELIQKKIYGVTLMVCQEPEVSKCVDSPSFIAYTINGTTLINVKTTSIHGTDISSMCKLGNNSFIIHTKNCCCAYTFGIRYVECHSTESVSEKIKNSKYLDYESSLERVRNSFKNDMDVEELSLRISLRCPLSLMRIATPARGNSCNHLQCFDLSTYLQFNVKKPSWKCPVCYKALLYKELVVDGYVDNIIKNCPSTAEEVEIAPDATWTIPSESRNLNGKRKLNSSNAELPKPKKQNVTSTDMDEAQTDDDESSSSAADVEVIDLT